MAKKDSSAKVAGVKTAALPQDITLDMLDEFFQGGDVAQAIEADYLESRTIDQIARGERDLQDFERMLKVIVLEEGQNLFEVYGERIATIQGVLGSPASDGDVRRTRFAVAAALNVRLKRDPSDKDAGLEVLGKFQYFLRCVKQGLPFLLEVTAALSTRPIVHQNVLLTLGWDAARSDSNPADGDRFKSCAAAWGFVKKVSEFSPQYPNTLITWGYKELQQLVQKCMPTARVALSATTGSSVNGAKKIPAPSVLRTTQMLGRAG